MKNSTVIFLSLLILLSLAISFMSLGGFDDDPFEDPKTTTSEPSSSSKQTSATQSSPSGVYLDGDYGYQTIGNITYFFKSHSIPSTKPNCYITLVNKGTYVSSYQVSWDLNSWKHVSSCSGYVGYQDGSCKISSGASYAEKIYITYSVVTNCENPVEVLNDLKTNVFNDDDYYYVSFIDPVGNMTEAPAN